MELTLTTAEWYVMACLWGRSLKMTQAQPLSKEEWNQLYALLQGMEECV